MYESTPVDSRSLDDQSPGLVLVSSCLRFLLSLTALFFDHLLEFKPLKHTFRLVQSPLFSFATGILLEALLGAGEVADSILDTGIWLNDCSADSVFPQ